MAVVVLAATGALLGLLWFWLWDQPTGVVSGGQWFTDEHGLRDDFEGTGLYVAIAAPAGLVLGVVLAWLLDRSELVTLAAVVVGSVLAAYLMHLVGTHLGPADPHQLATAAEDGTKLPGDLAVRGWAPYAAFPFGALLGAAAVWFLTSKEPADQVETTAPAVEESRLGVGTKR